MRNHIRRDGLQEISAAWFVVPMSVAAAVLIAMSADPEEPAPPRTPAVQVIPDAGPYGEAMPAAVPPVQPHADLAEPIPTF